ncbi:MAG: helix-turn-helix domain-containing protein [Terriglobales bacterium]|jgi:predicted DNA-binding transcriptional regulator AlpA
MTTEIQSTRKYLTPREAAAQLGVAVGTLAVWRCKKRYGLNYVKIGSKVGYRQSEIEKFLDKRTR